MGHAKIDNSTPFAFETAYATDENGHPLIVGIVKATYSIAPGGELTIADKQLPVNLAGELLGEPGQSSYKYEPECTFMKPSTDVVLIGHAHAPGNRAAEVNVRLRVDRLDKTVRVVGDRYWVRSLGMIEMTSPEPFESIPLVYERAFGGWDRTHPDPAKHAFEPRNPVGTGYRSKHNRMAEPVRLPNLEDPRNPIRSYGDNPPPAGFGFTAPDWQPRAFFAGTYDDAWLEQRMPLLPKDYDRRFFNAASPGLVAPGYLNGDEAVVIENASPRGTVSFDLPGVPPPRCRVQLKGRRDAIIQTTLDTVIANTDEDILVLIWRGYLAVQDGPHDILSIQVQTEGTSALLAAG